MKLSFENIKEIALGALLINEENGLITFKRFIREEEELYRVTNQEFYKKTFSNAGVKLSFKTNSKKLYLDFEAELSTTRRYFAVDVCVNNKLIGSIDNYFKTELERDYTKMDFPFSDYQKEFSLGDGDKEVCIHLPWSAKIILKEISVDDGSYITPVKPEKLLLAYGDSITHGYDSLHPSSRYISKLAEFLNAEEINKAIGGEKFFPPLSEIKNDIKPDYITVAYGSNDWGYKNREEFVEKVNKFFINISKNYPDAKIFAITPIWRADITDENYDSFRNIEKDIIKAVENIKNVSMISGFDLVPQNTDYYADLFLHPNDEGFKYYAENIIKKIKTFI